MPQRLIRLTLYDEGILSALDRLSRVRKQSMFVVEAIRHYIGTVEGRNLLDRLTLVVPAIEELDHRADQDPMRKDSQERKKDMSNLDDIFG